MAAHSALRKIKRQVCSASNPQPPPAHRAAGPSFPFLCFPPGYQAIFFFLFLFFLFTWFLSLSFSFLFPNLIFLFDFLLVVFSKTLFYLCCVYLSRFSRYIAWSRSFWYINFYRSFTRRLLLSSLVATAFSHILTFAYQLFSTLFKNGSQK